MVREVREGKSAIVISIEVPVNSEQFSITRDLSDGADRVNVEASSPFS